jgi:iron complex outermembrane receptor protein
VGIYADDVYLNAPIAGGGPLFDLERIEILRGPQGTLYGKNTTAGAVNVISKKPTFDTDGYGTVGFGSKNERIVTGAIGGALVDEKLAGRVALYSEERDGFQNNDFDGNTYGDVNKKAIRLQFLAQLNPDLDALLKLHSRQFKGDGSNGSLPVGRYYNVGYERPQGRDISLNVNEDYRLDHDGASLTFNWYLGDYTLTSISAYDYIRNRSTSDADYTPYEVNGAAITDNSYRQWSQELRLASPKTAHCTGWWAPTTSTKTWTVLPSASSPPAPRPTVPARTRWALPRSATWATITAPTATRCSAT